MQRCCVFLLLFVLTLCGCGSKASKQAVETVSAPSKHYSMTGKVVSLNTKEQTASIDAEAIPGYMEAMIMDYPIADKSEFEKLRAGEKIQGTLDVWESGDYKLRDIHTK